MLFRLFSSFLLVLVLAACSEPPYKNINNKELSIMIEQGVSVYDVRRADEWRETGVIDGSKLLTFVGSDSRMRPDFMPRFTEAVSKNEPVILICRTGNRTSKLAKYLVEQLGYSQVYNVRNGIVQWIREGNAVIQVLP
ncbi:MAG: rhodanese-like domain-containing protein [Gammaproteobacteria bacterium]|nr:rhodanese-like domain-containing protein [Gammaproteobacteria bacterium]MCW8911512.1 rhodanese-like domain-containing protein [Gammaproteobacteria bacterium]MCW9005881.1 rhodanese-like domain-containing protein [Gammaproteobacteria bacterium]MCW9055106.1 rhodanese-like domain-containing protein [Gammaproteobacteria bacterium]